MSRFTAFIGRNYTNLKRSVLRFPVTILLLLFLTVMVSLSIEGVFDEHKVLLARLIYATVLGIFLGTAVQFACERISRRAAVIWILRAVVLAAAVVWYFLVNVGGNRYDLFTTIRLSVICCALLSAYIWVSSAKGGADFGDVALVHFKSFMIAFLYGGVLIAGLNAIYAAINLLLVKLNSNIPVHIISIIGIFFIPFYYLSLLPDFNSKEPAENSKFEDAAAYPRFLEILVSYIAIPLITAFTGVLTAYLIKILVTLKWPIGQLGPMILAYSAAGLLIYILCGRLSNRWAKVYRFGFPIALIPLVCLQLVSVFIRLKAYGVTESRYYVALFGIFSVVCALYLIISKHRKPGVIALLAACFALLSILPPIDAFTVSRISQTDRIETVLEQNNMLENGKISPNAGISANDKYEITSVMNYLYNMGYTSHLNWVPKDYNINNDFESMFGFPATYSRNSEAKTFNSLYISLDNKGTIDLSGYEKAVYLCAASINAQPDTAVCTIGGIKYTISAGISDNMPSLSVSSANSSHKNTLSLKSYIEDIKKTHNTEKGTAPMKDLTYNTKIGGLNVRVIFQSVSFDTHDDKTDIYCKMLLLLGAK